MKRNFILLTFSILIASSANAQESGTQTASSNPIASVKHTSGYTGTDGEKVYCVIRKDDSIECSSLPLKKAAISLRWVLSALSESSELKCKPEFELHPSGMKFECTLNGKQDTLDFRYLGHGYYWQASATQELQLSKQTVNQKIFGYVVCKDSNFDYVSKCSGQYTDHYGKIVANVSIGVDTYDGLLKYISYFLQ